VRQFLKDNPEIAESINRQVRAEVMPEAKPEEAATEKPVAEEPAAEEPVAE